MSFLSIDPGTTESALVELSDDLRPIAFGKFSNEETRRRIIAARIRGESFGNVTIAPTHLAIEMIASYGMPVGHEVFETCVWIGRFAEAWCGPHTLLYRAVAKIHLCRSNKATDANIRQALIDLYGGKEKAIGTTKKRGPLYGISGDMWAALAVGVTWHATRAKEAA